jgi:hypothetical protein
VGNDNGEAVGVALGSTEGEVDGKAVGMAVSAGVGCFVVASVLEGNDKENEYEYLPLQVRPMHSDASQLER